MAAHQSYAVSVPIEETLTSPLFVPLLELEPSTTLIASQCAITVTGAASPLICLVMLCEPGTALGDPAAAVLYTSDEAELVDGEPLVLPGSIPALPVACVLGLAPTVQGLPAGATVTASLSTVR